MLTVLDEYTRQALAVAVRTRMGARQHDRNAVPHDDRVGNVEFFVEVGSDA